MAVRRGLGTAGGERSEWPRFPRTGGLTHRAKGDGSASRTWNRWRRAKRVAALPPDGWADPSCEGGWQCVEDLEPLAASEASGRASPGRVGRPIVRRGMAVRRGLGTAGGERSEWPRFPRTGGPTHRAKGDGSASRAWNRWRRAKRVAALPQDGWAQPSREARWWAHQDLNLEPADYEPAALTVELWARNQSISETI